MSRAARSVSGSGFYHVMARGDGKRILFEDHVDYEKMLALLCKSIKKYPVKLLAWCFMSNHIHLLILDEDGNLSKFMQSLTTSYARYYNGRSGRVGHVFQERYRSEAIEAEQRLVDTFRYIHLNPERAGICPADEYAWSSYREYASDALVTDTSVMVGIFGSLDELFRYIKERRNLGEEPVIEFHGSEDDAAYLLAKQTLGINPALIASFDKNKRNSCLQELRNAGLTIKRVSRLTGLGESTVKRYTRVPTNKGQAHPVI